MYDNSNDITINSLAFNTDFDDIGWDPIEVDDSDQEMSERFGY